MSYFFAIIYNYKLFSKNDSFTLHAGPFFLSGPLPRPHTVLPNGVKVAVSDNGQKCQKLTNVGLTSGLQLFLMYFI